MDAGANSSSRGNLCAKPGFRVPNVFDLSQLGSRPGNRFAIPNPDLKPEEAVSVDAGLKAHTERLSAEVFGFYLRVDDKIEALPTGELTPDGRVIVRSDNVNTVDYAGAELGLQAQVGAGGLLYGSLNYVWGEEMFDDGMT